MDGDLEYKANAYTVLVNNYVSMKAHSYASWAGHVCFVLNTVDLFVCLFVF